MGDCQLSTIEHLHTLSWVFLEFEMGEIKASLLAIVMPRPTCAETHYLSTPNITRPQSLKSGAEFDAAPMHLRGGSDASSSGSIFQAPPRFGPLMIFFC